MQESHVTMLCKHCNDEKTVVGKHSPKCIYPVVKTLYVCVDYWNYRILNLQNINLTLLVK